MSDELISERLRRMSRAIGESDMCALSLDLDEIVDRAERLERDRAALLTACRRFLSLQERCERAPVVLFAEAMRGASEAVRDACFPDVAPASPPDASAG